MNAPIPPSILTTLIICALFALAGDPILTRLEKRAEAEAWPRALRNRLAAAGFVIDCVTWGSLAFTLWLMFGPVFVPIYTGGAW